MEIRDIMLSYLKIIDSYNSLSLHLLLCYICDRSYCIDRCSFNLIFVAVNTFKISLAQSVLVNYSKKPVFLPNIWFRRS